MVKEIGGNVFHESEPPKIDMFFIGERTVKETNLLHDHGIKCYGIPMSTHLADTQWCNMKKTTPRCENVYAYAYL